MFSHNCPPCQHQLTNHRMLTHLMCYQINSHSNIHRSYFHHHGNPLHHQRCYKLRSYHKQIFLHYSFDILYLVTQLLFALSSSFENCHIFLKSLSLVFLSVHILFLILHLVVLLHILLAGGSVMSGETSPDIRRPSLSLYHTHEMELTGGRERDRERVCCAFCFM